MIPNETEVILSDVDCTYVNRDDLCQVIETERNAKQTSLENGRPFYDHLLYNPSFVMMLNLW